MNDWWTIINYSRVRVLFTTINCKKVKVASRKCEWLNTFNPLIIERLQTAGSSPGSIASLFLMKPFILSFLFVIFISAYFLHNVGLIYNKENSNIKVNSTLAFIFFYFILHANLGDPLIFLLIFTPSYIPFIMLSIYATKTLINEEK